MSTPVERDDRDMIMHQDRWPVWPFLPMKGPEWKAGFFMGTFSDDVPPVFYVGNIFDREHARETDMTVDQVLAEGWKVD